MYVLKYSVDCLSLHSAEPDPSELPESYFLESGRGGSQEEGEDDMERGESVR